MIKILISSLVVCMLSIEISAQTCVPPPSNLIAWYRAQNNALDTSQYANHGTLQNGASFAVGKVGQAFVLDGVDDAVTAPQTIPITSSFTAEAWINPTSLQNNPVVFERSGGENDRIGLQILPDGTFGGYLDSPNQFNVIGGTIPTNTFTHVVYLFDDAANSARLYVNGVQVASATETRSPFGNTGTLTIGGSPVSAAPDFFPGLIDELTLYNRALTDAEIQGIFNAGSAGKCLGSTAASVQIGGRVVAAEMKGRGVAGARVILTDMNGTTRTALTNTFGYYRFEGVAAGETYIFEVRHKRYRFAPQIVSVTEQIDNLNFTATTQ